jgi:hypothetical protein
VRLVSSLVEPLILRDRVLSVDETGFLSATNLV